MTSPSNFDQPFLPGSILKRNLDGLPGVVYSHVGIYVGQNQVIHFNGTFGSGTEARIETCTLEAFSKGRPLQALAAPKEEKHGQAVIAEARRMLEDSSAWSGRYNFVFRNCEDFAQHCFEVRSGLGRRDSRAPWSQRAKTIAGGLGAVIVTVTTLRMKKGAGADPRGPRHDRTKSLRP